MRSSGQIVGGRYRIERHLGSGGMGEVYLAVDAVLGRRVAIKVLPSAVEGDLTARERLRREARAAAALDHPFICKIHEVGESDGESFIVMEFVDGDTLHQLMSAALPVRQVLDLAHALAQALEEAHQRGITHRDLKPGNIMVTRQGHVKVLDFGLAKQVAASAAADSTGGGTILTDPGTRVGTPAYMSPEQILGGSVDPRSDIFSLGVILHEMVSGAHPFKRDTPAETMAAVLRDSPSNTGRDLEAVPGLRDVIHRTLSKACAERYQTMGELRAELDALRERSWLSTPSAGTPPASRTGLPAERTPFVAREAELAELRAALDQMLLGQGGIILIGGEPGVGKTRLVRELQREAHQRGCMVLTGHCYEMEGSPPFVPFTEYMEHAARIVPQALRAALGDDAAAIATIVPGLRRAYPDIPPALDVPPEQQRRVSFNAFLEFLQRATKKSPSVLLFDDLHWADEPTLQLLQHLAPHMGTVRSLLVGTYRDVELDVKKPFARTLESLLRQRLARRISLRRLASEDVEQMLTRMSGAPAPSSVVRVVFHETEGNPFFVEEVYQHLAEEGRLFDAAGQWRGDLQADTLNVPESVKLVIGRRLERLSETTRKILTAAAVIGRTFPLDLLEAIVDADEDAVLDAVEQAEGASLVAAQAGRDARYGFVHELIRTTLNGGLSLPRRQRLHLKIADAIERLRVNAIDAHLPTLAHHLYQAGAAADLDRTAATLVKAAGHAQASGGFEEVLELTEHLLGLELPADDLNLAAARERRGVALLALGRRDESREHLDAAFHIYTGHGDAHGIARTSQALGASHMWSGNLAEACQALRRGLTHLSAVAPALSLPLRTQMVQALCNVGAVTEAFEELQDMTTAAPGDAASTALRLGAESWFYRAVGRYEQQSQSAARALELLPPGLLDRDRIDLAWNLAFARYYLGRFAEAEALYEQARLAAQRAGHPGGVWAATLLEISIRLQRSGDFAAAIADWTRISNEQWDFINRLFTGMFNVYLGHPEVGLRELREAAATQPRQHFLAGPTDAALFAAAALAGDRAAALAHLDAAKAWLPQDQFNSQGRWSAAMSVIAGMAFLDDREQLAALDPLGRRLAAHGIPVDTLSFGPNNSELCAGLTAAAAGDAARAEGHYETALRTAREIPTRIVEPMAQYWYGRFDLEQDRPASARARLEAAVAAFTELKMPLHRDRAARALAQAGA